MLDSYWHPLATSSDLHPSLVLELDPFNYVLHPPLELQQWVRQRGLDITCKDKSPDGIMTHMPPLVPDRNQASQGSMLGPGMFGDGDSSGSETSADSGSLEPQETAADLSKAGHIQTQVKGAVDSESSEDDGTGGYEYQGPYYVETAEQECDRLFGGIRDEDEREMQYRAYCRSIDELELGYC